jgi:hypothetical protein
MGDLLADEQHYVGCTPRQSYFPANELHGAQKIRVLAPTLAGSSNSDLQQLIQLQHF